MQVLPPDTLFLLGEHRQHVFEGEVFALLAPLLDGSRTIAEIMAALDSRISVQSLYGALGQLARRGCIVEAEGEEPGEHAAFWDQLAPSAGEADRALREVHVTVRAVGNVETAGLAASLLRNGLAVADDGELQVVVTDDYLRDELEAVNRGALAAGRPWLLVKPVGMVLWVGPLFRPGATGCWKCLEQRLASNRQVEHYIRARTGDKGGKAVFHTSRAALPSTLSLGLNLAATEIARAAALGAQAGLDGILLTLDLLSLALEQHVLVRRPQCPACGSPPPVAAEPRPPILVARAKPLGTGHGERTVAAAETFERYRHHISPVTGVVTSLLSRETVQHGLVHNYVAGHYFPMLSDDMTLLRVNRIARSGGKGTTEIQAKTSALCESIERYSGIAWGEEKRIEGSFRSLGAEAVHIRELTLFSARQYRDREALNARALSDRDFVPEPLDEDASISWSPAWSLGEERFRFLPTAYCYYGHRDPGPVFCRCDSNGAAAGNSLEEAIVQGFLELVERDSVALWWYNRLRRPRVDADSFDLPYWEQMKTHYRDALGRELHVLDLTGDLGIPVLAVVSRRLGHAVEDIVLGLGSGLDARAALLRALIEANQYLPALRQRTEDGSTVYQLNESDTISWWKTATYDNQPWLCPDPDSPAKVAADLPAPATEDVREDVLWCVEAARKRGLEVLVVEQTRPDIGLPVVKVVVPGMRHFWRRLAPGRLYDVPVELGWLSHAHAEHELNPLSCFV